ncbi:MAG: polysaccharide biosynthesis tyrosine autokinase [Rhodobacteraceae bacterium]|nr:polysaccharide biosynthesis tyrosine autokinase [Paracoccaceae bacterium]MCZ8255815.1 polysaccharide biosynthesis tyrosine autokinase [Polaromonas sp.]
MNSITNHGPVANVALAQQEDSGLALPPILLQYWHTVLRWRWLMAAIVASCVVAGIVITLLMAPLYSAKVQIQIDRQQKQVTKVEGVEAQTAMQDLEFYATQYALLKARPLAERVASELKLYNNKAFLEAHGIDGDVLEKKKPGQTEEQRQGENRKLVVALLLKNVAVSPIRTSKLVDVSYTSRSAALSAEIANKWAAAFISTSMDRQFASTADARAFLEERLETLRQRVEDSEKQVVLYGSQSGIVTLDQIRDGDGRTIGNRTLTGANLEQLAVALNEATAERISAQARAGGGGETASEAIASSALSTLKQRRAEAAAELAKLSVQFAPEYPAVQNLSEQVRAYDAAIVNEAARIAGARQREYREALAKETNLKAQVERLKAELDQQNRADIQYNIYQREADTNRELYDALLQRYKEIGVAGAVGVNNIAIVEPAIVPDNPTSPSLPINLTIAVMLGVGLAAVVAFALEQIDEGIREPAQVEPLLRHPLLGITPETEGDIVTEMQDPKSHLFDAYFSIRSSLSFATNHGLPKAFAVVSTRPGEGKSSTALALAQIIARTGKRVLLVDADLRSPSVHAMLGGVNEIGFSNYLAGDNDWSHIIQETGRKNLSMIAAGPVPPSAAELLSGDRLGQFVSEGLEKFDHIVIDSPPVLGMSDAPLIAKAVEGVVYVVQTGGAAVRGIRACLNRLKQVNGHVFGVVLTKVGGGAKGYGYGYGYGYGQRYGEDNED